MKEKKQCQEVKLIKGIIANYKRYINESGEIEQSLTSNYQEVMVQGGYSDGQAMQRKAEDKSDKGTYINSVDDILRCMPSTLRKIIIYRFYRKWKHDDIIEELGIDDDIDMASSTYYRWYELSVDKFYREALARLIEMKVGK